MKEIVTAILILTSSLVILVASIGIVRFRNLFARVHVVTKVSSFALVILFVAANIFFSSLRVTGITLLAFVLIVLMSPVAAHVIVKVTRKLKIEDTLDD